MTTTSTLLQRSRAGRSFPGLSREVNQALSDLARDIQELQDKHNTRHYPLWSKLPTGNDYTPALSFDAFVDGLSGATMFTDGDATNADSVLFWSIPDNRQNTLKETLLVLSGQLTAYVNDLQQQITNINNGASTYTKTYIGLKAFDSSAISAASSLDGLIDSLYILIGQVRGDTHPTYGSTNYIAVNDDIVTAVEKLDDAIATAIGTSYTAGTGLVLTGTQFSALNITALWNAAQIQGDDVVAGATDGQLLLRSAGKWTPTTITHGDLSGLGDNDHNQYLLRDGTNAMTSDLDMGSHNVISVGNVDGRDISTDGSTLDSHVINTSNPHGVTATQVGNTTAQWNANKLSGEDISTTSPNDGEVLVYDASGDGWTPTSIPEEYTATIIPIAHIAPFNTAAPNPDSVIVSSGTTSSDISVRAMAWANSGEIGYGSFPAPIPTRISGDNPAQARLVCTFLGKSVGSTAQAAVIVSYATNTNADILGNGDPIGVTWGNDSKQYVTPDNSYVNVVEFPWTDVVSTAKTGNLMLRIYRDTTDGLDDYADVLYLISCQIQWKW